MVPLPLLGGCQCGALRYEIRQAPRMAYTPSTGVLSVRSGTLDDTSWVEPVGDIWTRSAQPWALSGDRIRHERQPTDFAPFVERFRKQGRFAV